MSFIRLDPQDISISAESIVSPTWSTGNVALTGASQFVTSSNQIANNTGNFYYDVYNDSPNVAGSQVQFSIAFGNKNGGGAALYNSSVPEKSPTSTIYGQYRNLVLGDEDSEFIFGSNPSDSIYIININRANYKEKLFPGTFNLTLASNNVEVMLTDNSNIISTISYVDSGRVFDIISGSNGGKVIGPNNGLTAAGNTFGKFLPDIGVIILNSNALSSELGISPQLGNTGTENNPGKLYNLIKAGENFELQSEETITSNFVFVRARNAELNYSTNPSYITGSGELRHNVMINSPQSYITAIGLYNDANDLIAVAKLSRPAHKDFTTEALFRITLNY